MAGNWRIVGSCLAMAALLAVAGCSSATDNPAEANLASINGDKQPGKGPDAKSKTPAAVPDRPVVKIETSLGDITVRLDKEKSPATVDNFLSYVESNFYDQTVFHQVLKNYVILGGGYSADLTEKPTRGATLRNEARDNKKKNLRGTIAMSRRPDMIDSSTSQFFINLTDNPHLDHKAQKSGVLLPPAEEYGYCVFGEVTDGMDVVEKIGNVPVHDKGDLERTPVQPVLIKSIRRVQ